MSSAAVMIGVLSVKASAVGRHMMIHVGKKPYSRELCVKSLEQLWF